MTTEEVDSAIAVSTQMSELLRDLEEKVFVWADKKEKIYKKFTNELERFHESLEDMEEEWFILCSNQFAAGKIFAEPAKLKKFLNKHRDSLNREEKQAIRRFLENPWFYSLFSVEKVIEANVLRIYDYLQNRSLLLCSDGVRQMHRTGKKLYLCLLYDNGECCQTYGLINYFRDFSVKDIECYARFADSRYEREGDLSLAVHRNPVPFMMLYRYSEMPRVYFKGELKEYCHHSITVEDFSPGNYAQTFKFEEKEGILRGIPKKNKQSFFFKCIYYDKESKTLHIQATNIKHYESMVKLLSSRYDFPPSPSTQVNAALLFIAEELLGIESPTQRFEMLFEEVSEPLESETVEHLNALFGDVVDSFNAGVEFSPQELAEKHGFSMEEVKHVQEQLGKSMARLDIDIEGGFENFTPPPPAERDKFAGLFTENSLFRFNSSIKAGSHLRTKLPDLTMAIGEGINLDALPFFLEELFFDFWGEEIGGCTILLYTLYLLHEKGKTFRPVRDYAVEFLRLFWQTLLPDKSKKNIEAFIIDYALFCREVLYTLGLVEIDGKLTGKKAAAAAYKIKASPFFYEWLRPIRAH